MRGQPKGDLKKILAKAAKDDLNIGAIGSVTGDVVPYSTGNIAIDAILGVGGLPQGRSVELYGPPSCGKTTTALQCAAWLQNKIKSGGAPELNITGDDMILYMDHEHALDKDYAAALGLDVEDESTILFAQPDTLEDSANYAIELIETGMIRLVIFDSVAAMQPSAKAEAEIGKSLPAVQAKLMADFTVKLNPILKAYDCTALFLNHEREVMEMGGARRPGMPARKTTPGGISVKYYTSVRIRYAKIKDNKETIVDPLTKVESDISTSSEVLVKVEKNKVGPPFRQAQVRVRYGRGFDNFYTAMQILVAHKKVIVSGAYYYFHNLDEDGLAPEWMQRATTGIKRPYVQGQAALFKAADEDLNWRAGIIAAAQHISAHLGDEAALAVPDLEPAE
jgi:recombination protein RecA